MALPNCAAGDRWVGNVDCMTCAVPKAVHLVKPRARPLHFFLALCLVGTRKAQSGIRVSRWID